MTILSVYRPAKPRLRYDQAEVFAGLGTAEDTKLLGLAIRTTKAVLVGLDGESTIVKPEADGDGSLSFEALYDDCYTVADLARMAETGAATPDEVPHDTFVVDFGVPVQVMAELTLALTAQNQASIRARVRELATTDPMFQQELTEKILERIRIYLDAHGPETILYRFVHHVNTSGLDVTLRTAEAERWRFLDRD